MKTRNYAGLVVEGRIPTVREAAIAAGLTVTLADQPGIGAPLAGAVGLLALGSIRVRRAPADNQPAS